MDREERKHLHRVVDGRGMKIVEIATPDRAAWRQFAYGERDHDGSVIVAIEADEARENGFVWASGGRAFELLLSVMKAEGPVPAIQGCWYGSIYACFRLIFVSPSDLSEDERRTIVCTQAPSEAWPVFRAHLDKLLSDMGLPPFQGEWTLPRVLASRAEDVLISTAEADRALAHRRREKA